MDLANENDLKILITGSLNIGKSIGEINTQLKALEKKINKLKLNIEVNDKVMSQLTNFTKQMSRLKDQALNTGKVIEEMIQPDGSKVKRTYFDGLKGEFSEIVKQADKAKNSTAKQADEVNALTDKYKTVTKEVIKYNKALEETGRNQILKNGNDTLSVSKDAQGNVKNYSETKNAEKDLKDQQKLIDQMARAREQSIERVRKEEQALAEAQAKASNKNIEQTQKEILQEKKKTEELEHQLRLFKERAKIDAQNLVRRYDGKFDQTSLNAYLDNVNKLNTQTPNLRREMDNLSVAYKKIGSEVRTANSHSVGFLEQVGVAFQRFPIWVFTASAIYGPLRALQDMTSQIIEIDTALTNLARVTDMDDTGLNEFLGEAINLSNELSNRLTDVLKIAEEFSRMGFQDNELLDITKQAQMLQNISDLDAQAAVDTLTSAMLNFNIAAEDSVRITDQLNEVDNNFAISTQDLSDGIRKSASTAKTFGKLYAA